jgi:hypothetical protein
MTTTQIRTGDMVKVDGRWYVVGRIAHYFGTDLPTEVEIIDNRAGRKEYRYASEIAAHEARS